MKLLKSEIKLYTAQTFERLMADHFEQKLVEAIKVTHEGIKCDGCQIEPILGIRYKCGVCPIYELCSLCESKSTHDHPMLKMRKADPEPF